MTFQVLSYFIAVTEEGSFAKAAEKLFVSQQSLSEAIGNLEKEYGTPLFYRRRPLQLTYAGQKLLDTALEITLSKKNLEQQLKDIRENKSGVISIGISHSRGRIWLPEMMNQFNQRYPDVKFNVSMGTQEDRENKLVRGQVDFILGFDFFSNTNICVEEVGNEKVCLIVPRTLMESKFGNRTNQMLLTMMSGTSVEAFADEPFLLVNNSRLRELAMVLFNKGRVSPNIIFEGPDVDMILSMCIIQQKGICLYPGGLISAKYAQMTDEAKRSICVFPLRDSAARNMIILGYHKNNPPSALTREFIELFKKIGNNYLSSFQP